MYVDVDAFAIRPLRVTNIIEIFADGEFHMAAVPSPRPVLERVAATRIKNPFDYFTQLCYWAFVRRIKQEKRVLELYDRLIERNGFDEVFSEDNENSDIANHSDYNSIKDAVHSRMRY
jgi:hypothetical protein